MAWARGPARASTAFAQEARSDAPAISFPSSSCKSDAPRGFASSSIISYEFLRSKSHRAGPAPHALARHEQFAGMSYKSCLVAAAPRRARALPRIRRHRAGVTYHRSVGHGFRISRSSARDTTAGNATRDIRAPNSRASTKRRAVTLTGVAPCDLHRFRGRDRSRDRTTRARRVSELRAHQPLDTVDALGGRRTPAPKRSAAVSRCLAHRRATGIRLTPRARAAARSTRALGA